MCVRTLNLWLINFRSYLLQSRPYHTHTWLSLKALRLLLMLLMMTHQDSCTVGKMKVTSGGKRKQETWNIRSVLLQLGHTGFCVCVADCKGFKVEHSETCSLLIKWWREMYNSEIPKHPFFKQLQSNQLRFSFWFVWFKKPPDVILERTIWVDF